MFQNIETKNPLQIKQLFTLCLSQKYIINVKFKKCTALIDRVHRRLSKSYGFCELYAHISIYFIIISVFFLSISLNLFKKIKLRIRTLTQ